MDINKGECAMSRIEMIERIADLFLEIEKESGEPIDFSDFASNAGILSIQEASPDRQ